MVAIQCKTHLVALLGLSLACLSISCNPPKSIAKGYLERPALVLGKAQANTFQVEPPKSVVFSEYQGTFSSLYPDEAVFKREFASAVMARITPGAPPQGPAQRVVVDEVVFGSDTKMGFFLPTPIGTIVNLGKDYCLLRIRFRITDAAGVLVSDGVLVAANSKGHWIFSRKKRVQAAIDFAESKLAALVSGQLPAAEMQDKMVSLDL